MLQRQIVVLEIEDNTPKADPPAQWDWSRLISVRNVKVVASGPVSKTLADNDDESETFSLSDCINYESNVLGDCSGRVWRDDNGTVRCETCFNRRVGINEVVRDIVQGLRPRSWEERGRHEAGVPVRVGEVLEEAQRRGRAVRPRPDNDAAQRRLLTTVEVLREHLPTEGIQINGDSIWVTSGYEEVISITEGEGEPRRWVLEGLAWDASHGLTAEVWLGECVGTELVSLVRALLERTRRDQWEAGSEERPPRTYIVGLPVSIAVHENNRVHLSIDAAEVSPSLTEDMGEERFTDEEIRVDRSIIDYAWEHRLFTTDTMQKVDRSLT